MKAKIKKGIKIGILVIILVIISDIIGWPIKRVSIVGAKMNYIYIYKDYYLMTKDKKALLNLGDGGTGYKEVYFLPFQRGRMLEKIKEDINNYLEKLVEEHGDIFYKYEISDDFRTVYIYKVSNDSSRDWRYDLELEVGGRISSLIALYHNIKEGHSKGFSLRELVNFIEPSDSVPG